MIWRKLRLEENWLTFVILAIFLLTPLFYLAVSFYRWDYYPYSGKSVNYWLLIGWQILNNLNSVLCGTIIILVLVASFGLLITTSSHVKRLFGLSVVLFSILISCGSCMNTLFIDTESFAHIQSVRLKDRTYHLTRNESRFWEGATGKRSYLLYECDSRGMICHDLYIYDGNYYEQKSEATPRYAVIQRVGDTLRLLIDDEEVYSVEAEDQPLR